MNLFSILFLAIHSQVFTIDVIVLKDKSQYPNAFVFSTNYQIELVNGHHVFDIFDDGLYFAHHTLLTGDTTKNYLYPFIEYNAAGATLYVYPDISLQNSKNFKNLNPVKGFLSWFEYNTVKWMSGHECTGCNNVISQSVTTEQFESIKCTLQ